MGSPAYMVGRSISTRGDWNLMKPVGEDINKISACGIGARKSNAVNMKIYPYL